MSHLTGVATGTLGVYLRWVVHTRFPGHQPNKPNISSMDTPNKEMSENQPYLNKRSRHHMNMRKMMENQNEPVLISGKQVAEHARGVSMTTSACVLMVVVVLLLVGYGFVTKGNLQKYSCVILRRGKTSHVI
jgi:hypothetical protein